MSIASAVVVLPTYNERANLPEVVHRILSANPDCDVLVVDDNSPDGTGAVADGLSAASTRVTVLHRERKQGLGRAYLEGFGRALDQGYETIVEMDADLSHQPEQLGRLLIALDDADLVQGSRWVAGGEVVNWPTYRRLISKAGSWYARTLLRLPVKDVTGGFRAYRASALRRINLDHVESEGYCFQIDMVGRCVAEGLRVIEVPITFVERARGKSKMTSAIVLEAMIRVTVWGLQGTFRSGAKTQKRYAR